MHRDPARGSADDRPADAWRDLGRATRVVPRSSEIGVISYQLVVFFRPGDELERVTLIVGEWFPSPWDLEVATIAAAFAAIVVAAGRAPPGGNRRWRVVRIHLSRC